MAAQKHCLSEVALVVKYDINVLSGKRQKKRERDVLTVSNGM